MNERIKQLWLDGAQSLWPRPGKCTAGEYDYNLEKFAELIVKEMLKTCEEHSGWTGRMIGEQIKQHFGVEE